MERNSITSKVVLTQHGNRHRQHFSAVDMEITMWLSNTHTNNINHTHGIPPGDPKVMYFHDGDSMLLLYHLQQLFKLPAVIARGLTHPPGVKAETFSTPQMYNILSGF